MTDKTTPGRHFEVELVTLPESIIPGVRVEWNGLETIEPCPGGWHPLRVGIAVGYALERLERLALLADEGTFRKALASSIDVCTQTLTVSAGTEPDYEIIVSCPDHPGGLWERALGRDGDINPVTVTDVMTAQRNHENAP